MFFSFPVILVLPVEFKITIPLLSFSFLVDVVVAESGSNESVEHVLLIVPIELVFILFLGCTAVGGDDFFKLLLLIGAAASLVQVLVVVVVKDAVILLLLLLLENSATVFILV